MTRSINKASQGIMLTLGQNTNGACGTVVLLRNNQPGQMFSGTLCEALQQAERLSMEHGFGGCYDTSRLDDVKTIQPNSGVIGEIQRQISTFRSRWTTVKLASIPAASAHLTRLMSLRDALFNKVH